MQTNNLIQRSAPTLEEWYAKPMVHMIKTSEQLGWDNMMLRYSGIYPTAEAQPIPKSDQYCLVMVVGSPTRLSAQIVSDKSFEDVLLTGATQLITPYFEASGIWDSATIAAFVEVSPHLIYQLADEMFRGDPYRIQLTPCINFHDALLRSLVEVLLGELYQDNPFGALYAASITQVMTLHLLKTRSKLTARSTTSVHRLSKGQIRIIEDYIDSRLSEKIALSDMAELLHISVSHFERIFRATFGRPPYQYVIERRVERAKQLLSRPYISLHDVACICGFANQSHLTRHFTRLVGVTPAHFARYSGH